MDVYTHTILTLSSLYGAYWLGGYLKGKSIVEKAIGHTLESLEKEGLILTRDDKHGEKDIVPISEIIAKATRDAIK